MPFVRCLLHIKNYFYALGIPGTLRFSITVCLLVALTVTSVPDAAFAAGAPGRRDTGPDAFSLVLLLLATLFFAIIIGRWSARLLRLPNVLGELLIGVAIGNIGYALGLPLAVLTMHLDDAIRLFHETWFSGLSVPEAAASVFTVEELAEGGIGRRILDATTGTSGPQYVLLAFTLWLLSHLGVILLLFMVGLESSVPEMMKVGSRALLVAIVGVVAPFGMGFAVSTWMLPELSFSAHLFLGATLAATSVGITARVLKDLGKLHLQEAKIILGAAVIDDVLGLIVLAVVVGIVATGEFHILTVLKLCFISFAYLAAILYVGETFLRKTLPVIARYDRGSVKFLLPLCLVFLLSWTASLVGLAPIVGAFAAGLILSDSYFGQQPDTPSLQSCFGPLESFLAPIFFVLMGMQVNLESFLNPETLIFSGVLILVAVLGKLLCGLAAGKHLDRLSIGIGMIPRGEVGLIFASVGKGLGVVNGPLFSAIVMMVVATTFVAPFALQWSLERNSLKSPAPNKPLN